MCPPRQALRPSPPILNRDVPGRRLVSARAAKFGGPLTCDGVAGIHLQREHVALLVDEANFRTFNRSDPCNSFNFFVLFGNKMLR